MRFRARKELVVVTYMFSLSLESKVFWLVANLAWPRQALSRSESCDSYELTKSYIDEGFLISGSTRDSGHLVNMKLGS